MRRRTADEMMVFTAPDVCQDALRVDDGACIELEVVVQQARGERRRLFAEPAAQVRERFENEVEDVRAHRPAGSTRTASVLRRCNARGRFVFQRQYPTPPEVMMNTSLRTAAVTGALVLVLSTAANAATVRLVPVGAQSAGVSRTGCVADTVPASVAAAPVELPEIAAQMNVSGISEIRVDLDSRGSLASASVLHSSGNRWLDLAALRAARLSSYSPELRALEPCNLLILDEPTNHLDIKTKDIIKDALKAFDGTLILVSHDRDFLDGLVTKVYEFGHQRVKTHFEDINGFLANKKLENLKEIERKV